MAKQPTALEPELFGRDNTQIVERMGPIMFPAPRSSIDSKEAFSASNLVTSSNENCENQVFVLAVLKTTVCA